MSIDDIRAQELLNWLQNDLNLSLNSFQLASSDASFRRYFRIETIDGSFIVMDAPPVQEDIQPFIRVAELFQQAQIQVPKIYQQQSEQGFLLLEDFGNQSLLARLESNSTQANVIYGQAFDELFKLHQQAPAAELPAYDAKLLTTELDLFYIWFSEKLLGLQIPVKIKTSLNTLLIQNSLEQPQVWVHRDYHSRNLMLKNSEYLGVIDFQDAVIGAITYDLVSLLRDCYISWNSEQVYTWLAEYFFRLTQAELINCEWLQFKRWFDLMGLQRHLKAIGIFSRLHLRDHKSSYLADIPRTLAYVNAVCADYMELKILQTWLHEVLLPRYKQL